MTRKKSATKNLSSLLYHMISLKRGEIVQPLFRKKNIFLLKTNMPVCVFHNE